MLASKPGHCYGFVVVPVAPDRRPRKAGGQLRGLTVPVKDGIIRSVSETVNTGQPVAAAPPRNGGVAR